MNASRHDTKRRRKTPTARNSHVCGVGKKREWSPGNAREKEKEKGRGVARGLEETFGINLTEKKNESEG